jgi:hypothetical protein
MTKTTTAECIEWLKIVQAPRPYEKGEKYRSSIHAQLLVAQEMEAKHGKADADEVQHYESCECCQNFHYMEQKCDTIKKAAQEMAKALERIREVRIKHEGYHCSDGTPEDSCWACYTDKALTAWYEIGGQ